MEENMYSELLVELECPICTAYMTPPIRQCATGHSICEKCRKKLPKCPLCQGRFTEAKNLTLEALARKMHYPCDHKDSGCNAKLSFDVREQHQINCLYKGFKCGMERCAWMGKFEEIERHWEEKKTASKPYGLSSVCHLKLKPGFYYVNLVKAFNKLFWFKCKTERGNVFWAVQYIGANDDANKYYYQIEMYKLEASKRKAILSDYCHRMETTNGEMFQEGKCVCMSLDALRQYTGDDQVLVYHMRVHEDKNREEKKQSGDDGIKKQQEQGVATGVFNRRGKGHGNRQRARSQNPPKSGKKLTEYKK